MKKKLSIFVDPKTNQELKLRIEKERQGDIISGELYSDNNVYPIIRGIPRFVDESYYEEFSDNSEEKQTAKSFGIKWRTRRSEMLGFTKEDFKDLRRQFMAMLGCASERDLKNIFKNVKRVLNAGCGVAWSEYLFNYNQKTERHCVDISPSVESAYRKTKKIKNVMVSQASIFQLPYPDGIFDVIYSLGVLHHTEDPKKALEVLIEKLAPGGLIGIYIYNKKPFIREMVDSQIRRITTKMNYDECMNFSKKMTKLGKALSRIRQLLILKEDIELLGLKKGRYNIHRFIYDYFLKCWYNPKQDTKYADLVNQDWYHPAYASHHTKEEVISWFKKWEIKKIKCIQPKGWENSGYFISGIKK